MDKPDNIFLVGPMGAGKTTVGRRLAQVLQRRFIDSDKEIERRTGVDIPTIFELEGEGGFRLREKTVIADLTRRQGVVLATGGGVVLDADNRRCLSRRGIVIYLSTSVDEQLRRTRYTQRPLLRTTDPHARLVELLSIREPLYRQVADFVISTDAKQVGVVVQSILGYLENRRSCP